MSLAPLKPCCGPRCPRLTRARGGYCPACAEQRGLAYDRRRGTPTHRGYGAQWRDYRAWFLTRHPLCGDRATSTVRTTDSRCRLEQRTVLATVVDHIIPVRSAQDVRFYDLANHQSLCVLCHNRKRQRERVGR